MPDAHYDCRRLGLVLFLGALACTTGAQRAWSQQGTVERSRPGRRVDDKPTPTQVVRGKLVNLERNGIVIDSEGKQLAMAITRDTNIEFGAKGSLDFLVAGAIVVISGEMTEDGTVLLREHGWEGIEVCVTQKPPPRPVERGWEELYTAPAGSLVIPFKFVGTVLSREPLVVRPLPNYPQPRLGVKVPDQPVRKLPEFKNQNLTIETPKGEGMVKLNLGDRLDLLGEGAQATCNVAFTPNPVAVRIYIERAEPFKSEKLPDEEKKDKDKSKKSAKSTKKATGTTTGKKSGTTTPKAPKPGNP